MRKILIIVILVVLLTNCGWNYHSEYLTIDKNVSDVPYNFENYQFDRNVIISMHISEKRIIPPMDYSFDIVIYDNNDVIFKNIIDYHKHLFEYSYTKLTDKELHKILKYYKVIDKHENYVADAPWQMIYYEFKAHSSSKIKKSFNKKLNIINNYIPGKIERRLKKIYTLLRKKEWYKNDEVKYIDNTWFSIEDMDTLNLIIEESALTMSALQEKIALYKDEYLKKYLWFEYAKSGNNTMFNETMNEIPGLFEYDCKVVKIFPRDHDTYIIVLNYIFTDNMRGEINRALLRYSIRNKD